MEVSLLFYWCGSDDYDARTKQSFAKLQERTGIGRGGATSSGSGAELTDAIRAAGIDRKAFGTMSDADKRDAMKYNPRLRDAFSRHNSSRGFDFDGSGSGSGCGGDDITSPADMYAENKRRYDEYMANKAEADRKSQEMDQARRFYEMRNMGAGRAPPQMQGIVGLETLICLDQCLRTKQPALRLDMLHKITVAWAGSSACMIALWR